MQTLAPAWPPSLELYDLLRASGIGAGVRVLDLAREGAAAGDPLAQGGAQVTAVDCRQAERLPLKAASFDAAIAADVLHLVPQAGALAELRRVVRPRGLVAVWWPILSGECDVLAHRAAAANDLGLVPLADPLAKGFRPFYAAPFAERTLRVVPGVLDTTVAGWLDYERARPEVAAAYGPRASDWNAALEGYLLRAYGAPEAKLRVRVLHYVYLAKV
jgi:SAM-dependent methyltransferase